MNEAILEHGNQIALATADTIVSVLLPIAPFQVLGTIKSAYSTIKEELFNEKLKAFLSSDDNTITEKERELFLKILDKNRGEFFKRLFVVIDRLDSVEKAQIIGKLFKALVKGSIDIEVFLELTTAIEAAYIKDINVFLEKYSNKPLKRDTQPPWRKDDRPLRKLSSLGFLDHHQSNLGSLPVSNYEVTSLGSVLLMHGK